MKKDFFSKISMIFVAVVMLFCGCKTNFTATVYSYSDGFMTENVVTLNTLSPSNLLSALANARVITSAVTVNSFAENETDGEKHLTLDVNSALSQHLAPLDIQTQDMIIRCIANTFIMNYSAAAILLTCDGTSVKNEKYTYDLPLKFRTASITLEASPTASEVPTEVPSETAPSSTATPTDSATAKSTPFATPSRTDGKKYVAMTFDDGPSAQYTTKIVDKLKEYNAGATFFIVGNRVDSKTGAAIKYAKDNGNEIAIHGYTHTFYYNKCSDSDYENELSKTAQVIEQYTGIKPTLMRPIGGAISKERVSSCPYSVILWNVDSEDWKNKKDGQVDTIVNNVMSTVGDGKIILMHEIYKNSYEAFCIIIDKLYAQGYEVVTVTDLIGKDNLKPGTKFYSAN